MHSTRTVARGAVGVCALRDQLLAQLRNSEELAQYGGEAVEAMSVHRADQHRTRSSACHHNARHHSVRNVFAHCACTALANRLTDAQAAQKKLCVALVEHAIYVLAATNRVLFLVYI
jgi:hypothetical protein